ncbi:amidohydrolase family protein [Bradyrhizobium neotropicale]|uniref:amidohydrolase family protein n=1 Tax=Bradyrhizobium neotropicale TaxID=1497615 RepID=UPI001AD6CF22|nr:amidohydrolase family protein [Bradyrhizobium neotropicale]MBO4220884.1 amidohydrolase family protein [Bradyrhizobium neotropicale]
MTAMLIENAVGIFTGLPGAAMRATGAVRIRDGVIAEIGALEPQPDEQRIDARGCVIYPGLISTHHHMFQSVMKGVAAGINLPLAGWLRAAPYRLWAKLDEEALVVAAKIALSELLLSGTTTAADHHYLFSDTFRFDPANVIFEVARDLGIRLVFCRGGATKDRHMNADDFPPMPVETLDSMLKSVEACAQRFHDPSPRSLTRVALAPTTPTWSLDPGELKEVIAAARRMKLRLHSHLSETADYVDFCLSVHGKRPVEWLADHDWLGPDIWFAHLVHLDSGEVEILASTGTGMAHCPQSNCRLGSGVAPADHMARLGGAVSLGVDGAASNEAADMISEMHSCWHSHRAVKGAHAVTAEDVVHWATAGGARVLGFPEIGTLAPGQQADIAIFDLNQPRHFGMHDPLIAPVTCGGSAHVRYLLIGGRIVVEDGAIPGLDIAKLRSDALRVVERMAA